MSKANIQINYSQAHSHFSIAQQR